ncbi:MAG TPA: O-antigen ligase family protein [Mycobacteriales bacterium]|nr:O-antigen ligase family protein [Mycobacteriales bacterium]
MALVVLVMTMAFGLLALWGRPPVVLGALALCWAVLPGAIVLPGPGSALPNCARLVEMAALVGVVRYRLRHRDRTRTATPAAVAVFMAFLFVTSLTGVATLDPRLTVGEATGNWYQLAEQAVVLVLVLQLARLTRPIHAAVITTAAIAVNGAIGVYEQVTGSSYARMLYKGSPGQLATLAAQHLERRKGDLRARGTFEFALAYGWVLAAALPIVVVTVLMVRKAYGDRAALLASVAIPLTAAGIYLSRSRSPLLAALGLGAVLVLVLRPENATIRILGMAGILTAVALIGPEVVTRLSPSVDQGSVDIRFDRLPGALELASRRPFTGTGLGGVGILGPETLDSSYLTVWVEAGAIALTLLVLALAAALIGTARALPRPGEDSDLDGLLVLGCSMTLGALLVGSFAFDAFTLPSSSRWTWYLAAIGLAAAERRAGPARLPSWRLGGVLLRLALVGVAVLAGLGIRQAAPHHATGSLLLSTLDPRLEVTSQPTDVSTSFADTVCELGQEVDREDTSWRLTRCEEADPAGWVRLVVTAANEQTVKTGQEALVSAVEAMPLFGDRGLREPIRYDQGRPITGVPNLATTAPAVLGIAAFTGVVLVPGRRRRREEAEEFVPSEPAPV